MRPDEESVAAIVVQWLDALGADVYQEVEVSGGVADIVARVHAETWIVEVKTSLSLALVIQAMERRRLCHRVFMAAPYTRNMRDVGLLCDELGVGLLQVNIGSESWDRPRVTEISKSRRWNSRPVALTARLKPEHKTHARAGSVGAAGRWTPFLDTCEQVRQFVVLHPGSSIRDAVESIKHHYSSDRSARTSLAHWLERGTIKGVEARRVNGKFELHPTPSQIAEHA